MWSVLIFGIFLFYITVYSSFVFCIEKLPDADNLFNAVKKPSFIESNSSNTDIDWDKLAKSKMPLDSEVCKNTHAVPPPCSYEPQSAALKPTLGDPHEKALNERKRHSEGADEDTEGWCMKCVFITV